MKRNTLIILIVFVAFLSSCKEKESKQEDVLLENTENQTSNKNDVIDLKESDTKTTIFENGFMGFKTGDKINLESENLRKGTQVNGEGSFSGYDILNDSGEKVGFIFPRYNNKEIIEMIEINSPKYKTEQGIGIGSTYQDLKKSYPKIETHGSEIESRTSSNVGNLSFLLNVGFNTYEIDESRIKPETKVIGITIRNLKK